MQRRRETTLEEFDELVLLRSDLDQDDVIVAGADIAIDRREVMLGRWPAADRLGHGLGRYMLARRREPFGVGQFRHDRPAGDRPTKIVVSSFARRLLPVGVAQRHFSVARAGAAGACVRLNEVGSRLGHDQRIPLSSSEARGLGTAGGDRHRRLAVGPVEQAGMIEPQVLSPVVGEGACKQALNNVDGFRQALVTLAPPGPAGADDVLVQALSGAQSELNRLLLSNPSVAAPCAMMAGW